MTPKPAPFEVLVLYKTSRIFVYFSWLTLNWIYVSAYENEVSYDIKEKAEPCMVYRNTNLLISKLLRDSLLCKTWILIPKLYQKAVWK